MKTRYEKAEISLYKMWLFRNEEIKNGQKSSMYAIRDARLSGAIDLLNALGYKVFFNPLAENLNPFTVYKGE